MGFMLWIVVLSLVLHGSCMTPKFPAGSPWYQDVSATALDPDSNNVITFLESAGGWSGSNNNFQIDMSLNIQYKDATKIPPFQFVQTPDYYSPDCDALTTFPVTPNGRIEASSAYNHPCSGDCHYIVVDRFNKKLYESYVTYINTTANTISSQCGVVWDLCQLYPSNLRGDQCTSTDAAGFPIAPLLVTADELAAGVVDHALRFTMPNKMMRKGFYVHPASHAGGPTSTNANAILYGSRLRLKASFDPNTRLTNKPVSAAAVAIVNALKKYGMFLADGGNIPLCFADDAFTTAKYGNLNFDTHSLFGIKITDFDVLVHDTPTALTYNCVRNTFNTPSC